MTQLATDKLSGAARFAVLLAAVASLLFDGLELGLMPVASLSVSQSLLGESYTPELGGDWFARFTAALMLGAAVGGILLGALGDRIGRSRAMGVSILFYSLFAGLGAYARSQEEMLLLRFLVGLGVGGVWPNAVALVSECWPDKSRPTIAGLMGAALNLGILMLSQIARFWHITPDSWRWIFQLAAVPAALGVLVLVALPESPAWRAARRRRLAMLGGQSSESAREQSRETRGEPSGGSGRRAAAGSSPWRELLGPELWRVTLIGILVGSVPLVGAWAASKWMIPWADAVAKATHPGYKAVTQGWWALGAVLGSFSGAQVAAWLGRRRAYALISAGAALFTAMMFLATEPLQGGFLPVVFAQAFVTTLYFGWLPLYLPQMFPTHVRASGTGIAFNTGRFATAVGVFVAGALFAFLEGSYAQVGALGSLIYLLGLGLAPFIPLAPRSTHAEHKPSSGHDS
jgi:MFS transporter, SHS family, sialic acid transporter